MSRLRELNRYVGRRYDPASFDCADLAVLLQRDLFGKKIVMPTHRARRLAPAAAIERYRAELGRPIERHEIQDGDVVLICSDFIHIGTLFHVNGAWCVLHNSRSLGGVWLHRLSDLPALNLFIEGYYRWN
ncbi:hypothetical protein [Herbaspirillum sp. CAH-3]|uniref:hypothetical protein n=1 Tax=Herbaspirillum sp. CAH-3 TaxID=2605746 RepID=UPI0012ACFFDB|nr:hypothetical protein [Herbaspirillum sp. CAH-3]MRT31177.1 hypothetical protein [Herbaspirillum sp. CAH-3]